MNDSAQSMPIVLEQFFLFIYAISPMLYNRNIIKI